MNIPQSEDRKTLARAVKAADKFCSISPDTWKWLREEAGKRLEANDGRTHASVVAHWQSIRDGHVPFGLQVRE